MITVDREALRAVVSATSAETTSLDNLQAIVAITGDLITAVAVIVGGVWAYFKLVKNRTYRPRIDVAIAGAWVDAGGARRLHVTTSLRNIGASMVELIQESTGLGVDGMQAGRGRHVDWVPGPVVSIFESHAWIEPGETVTDDLIAPVVYVDLPVRIEVRLIWRWAGGRRNIQVVARKIIWPHDVEPGHTSSQG
jgi:hypothetical protein